MNSCMPLLSLPLQRSHLKIFYPFIPALHSCLPRYELLSPEQRREEQDAVAQSLRSADVPVPRNAASASVRSASSSSPLPSSLLPVTARCVASTTSCHHQPLAAIMFVTLAINRRQVSPVKSQVASFMDPPAKKPVEVSSVLALYLASCCWAHDCSDIKT